MQLINGKFQLKSGDFDDSVKEKGGFCDPPPVLKAKFTKTTLPNLEGIVRNSCQS